MAERSNATSKKNQDAAQDVSTLQKRGRRRLVGAIALVLLAVIVLPMVFDPEPRQNAPAVSIRIPNEEGTKFTPKASLKSAPQPEAPAVAPTAPEPAPPPETKATPPVEKPAAKAEAKAPETKAPPPAPKATEKPPGEQFVVQVGAYGSSEKVKEVVDLLKEAKIPQFTENVAIAGGTVTRVRIGPFASKAAADKERERVISLGRAKGLGLNPAGPVQK